MDLVYLLNVLKVNSLTLTIIPNRSIFIYHFHLFRNFIFFNLCLIRQHPLSTYASDGGRGCGNAYAHVNLMGAYACGEGRGSRN